MLDRRKEGRSPAYLGGQITTSRRLTAIDCIVRNTSGAGARLMLPNATLLPEIFELHIPRKNSAYRVQARWRRLEDVGVEIVPFEASDAPIPISLARRIRRLEDENAGLRKRLTEPD